MRFRVVGATPKSHRTGVCLLPLWAAFLRAPGQQVPLCGQRALPCPHLVM